ncbi:MAG: CHAT domain-containing protein [Planctomycetes bacterium]|nr:CHAT domain-containing protein [Planctomycetota bacterium]
MMAIGVCWAAAGLTLAIAVAQTESVPARPTFEQALQGAQALLAKDLLQARAAFEKILATEAWSGYRPLVEVGLATVDRLEQDPFAGLVRLQRAREQLVQQTPAGGKHPLHDMVQRRILIESMYCHVALGLIDLARRDLDALEPLLAGVGPRVRYGACQAAIDLRIGSSEWALARQRAQAALRDEEMLQAVPGARDVLSARKAMASRRLARSPDEAALVARELTDCAAAVSEAPLRFRLTMEAAAAWLAAGPASSGFAAARRGLEGLALDRPAAECAEVLAMRARHAVAAGDAGQLPGLRTQLAGAVQASGAAVRATPVRAGGVGYFHFEVARNALSVQLSLDRRLQPSAPEVAFLHLESGLALGTLSRRLGGAVATLAEVRARLLPERGGLLAYLLAPAGGQVVALDADGGVHEEFAVDEPFLAAIRELTREVEHEPADRSGAGVAALRQRAAGIAARLLPPAIAERLRGWRHVVLVGDEQGVGRIWQALPWDDTWTCTSFAVTHVGSATLGLALATRADQRRATTGDRLEVAVVGDPDHAPGTERFGVAPLQLSEPQREVLLAGLSTERQTWWRAEAKATSLRDPRIASARALCIVAHGIQDPARERFAGLLLAATNGDDGALFADQIESLVVPPLVVLAACAPGLAPQRVGEDGGSHPGGAFLMAGADTVVLASGQVPLAATLELTGAMFAARREGLGVAAALRRARQQIAGQAARGHPYYFAGLRAIGRPD